MTFAEKYDRQIVGAISGLLLPLIVALIFFLFSSGDANLKEYLNKIETAGIITHAISLSVFPNIFIFLVFNRLDMLRAARGVLGITLIWALIVFAEFLL
jgi:hypothetical protein